MSATSKTNKLMKLAGTVAALFVTTSNAVAMPVANCNKMMDSVSSLKAQIQNVNIFVADNRVVKGRAGLDRAYAPIGGLQTNEKVPALDESGDAKMGVVQATAFLVSPCYIVTNYHAVFGESSNPNKTDFSNSFYTFAGQGQHYQKTNAKPVVWGDYNKLSSTGNDWAILKLDTCVGQTLGWLDAAEMDASKMVGLTVSSSGYPGDKALSDLWTDPSCKIIKKQKGDDSAWLNTCAARPGASGSPLIHVGADGVPRVVAIQAHTQHETAGVLPVYDDAHANVAVDIGAALGGYIDIIKADRSKMNSNPAADTEVAVAQNHI